MCFMKRSVAMLDWGVFLFCILDEPQENESHEVITKLFELTYTDNDMDSFIYRHHMYHILGEKIIL